MTTIQQAAGEATLQVVVFRLGREEFAVEVGQVQEIVRGTEVTLVPRAPEYVEGVINLRGRVVPVINLARRLGLAVNATTAHTRIVICKTGLGTVGMQVDAVTEVRRLDASQIDPSPEIFSLAGKSDFFTGVAKDGERLLIMLDLPMVLSHDESAAMAELSGLRAQAEG